MTDWTTAHVMPNGDLITHNTDGPCRIGPIEGSDDRP